MPREKHPALTPEERAELLELRNDYDIERPTEVKMLPIPHHRLKRLVELERRDAAEAK